jgi:hypothetical protein
MDGTLPAMVRRKEVPKKPKEPLLTPRTSPGSGFRDNDSVGRSLRAKEPRDASMSFLTPTSIPSYMMATSCSGARPDRVSSRGCTHRRWHHRRGSRGRYGWRRRGGGATPSSHDSGGRHGSAHLLVDKVIEVRADFSLVYGAIYLSAELIPSENLIFRVWYAVLN